MAVSWGDGRISSLLALLLLLTVSGVAGQAADVDPGADDTGYHCLEYFIPVGHVLQELKVPKHDQITVDQTSRWCNNQCDANPSCTATWASGAITTVGATCKLLQHTTEDDAAIAKVQPGELFPRVQPAMHELDGLQRRSLAFLCFKDVDAWNDFGAAVGMQALQGYPGPSYCAYAHDVAGTNLARYSNVTSARECAQLCLHTMDCQALTFVVLNHTGPVQYDCWLKADIFYGENGLTTAYISDAYADAGAVLTCFSHRQDWELYGLILNPNAQTFDYNGLVFTLFPARVNFTEAQAVCAGLPDGRLAILSNLPAVKSVGQKFLPMLPFQRSLQAAWIGAAGSNAAANATLRKQCNSSSTSSNAGGLDQAVCLKQKTVSSLHWLDGHHSSVSPQLIKHLRQRTFSWMWHDNVLSYATAIPDTEKTVCGVIMNQVPPRGLPPEPGDSEPGIWYFDCGRRAFGFICQSSSIPPGTLIETGRVSAVVPHKTDPMTAAQVQNTSWRLAVAITLPVVALVLLLLLLACMCAPPLDRMFDVMSHQRKRSAGRPTHGLVSVVVTDIQGYSHLMEHHPDTMSQALLLHNQVIRQCCYTYAGFVMEQEGDSFILAFHDPVDAVAFALQVQQALLEVDLPPEIHYEDDWEGINTDNHNSAAVATLNKGDEVSVRSAPSAHRLFSLSKQLRAATVAGLTFTDPRRSGTVGVAATATAANLASAGSLPHSRSHTRSWSGRAGVDAAAGAGPAIVTLSRGYSKSQTNGFSPFSIQEGVPVVVSDLEAPHQVDTAEAAGLGNPPPAAAAGGGGTGTRRSGSRGHLQRLSVGSWCSTGAGGLFSPFASGNSATQEQAPAAAAAPAGEGGWWRSLRSFCGSGPSGSSDDFGAQHVTNSPASRRLAGGGAGAKAAASAGGGVGSGGKAGAVNCSGNLSTTTAADSYTRFGASVISKRGAWLRSVWGPGSNKAQLLFKGLRVRMGIASGTLHRGQDIASAEVYSRARVVSDAANGGQVLLDVATFKVIRQELHKLGAVQSRGINYSQLTRRKQMLQRKHAVHSSPDSSRSESRSGHDDAVVLDMGLYESSMLLRHPQNPVQHQHQHQRKHHQAFQGGSNNLPCPPGSSDAAAAAAAAEDTLQLPLEDHGHDLFDEVTDTREDLPLRTGPSWWHASFTGMRHTVSRMTSRVGSNRHSLLGQSQISGSVLLEGQGGSFLRLYQVLPPALVGRAAAFGCSLDLDGNWRCLDKPYFAAPGICELDQPKELQLLTQLPNASAAAVSTAAGTPQPPETAAAGCRSSTSFCGAAAGAGSAAGYSPGAAQVPVAPALTSEASGAGAGDAGGAVAGAAAGGAGAGAGGGGGYCSSTAQMAAQHSQAAPAVVPSAGLAAGFSVESQASQRVASVHSVLALRGASLSCNLVMRGRGLEIAPARYSSTGGHDDAAAGSGSRVISGSGWGPSAGPAVVYPPVTMVFTGVEGSQQLLMHQYQGIRQMHFMLHRLMLEALCLVPGGYLVRSQEGELRYMVAFATPAAAVEWCLVVQEAAMYLPYPKQLLQYRGMAAQHDASGRLVFRGPKLKMGLFEGSPKCITPDYQGRADYYGTSVNQAARYCDAAAHGGQIVTDEALAHQVLQVWQARAAAGQAASQARLLLVGSGHGSEGTGSTAAAAAAAPVAATAGPAATPAGMNRVEGSSRNKDDSHAAVGPDCRVSSTEQSAFAPAAAAAATTADQPQQQPSVATGSAAPVATASSQALTSPPVSIAAADSAECAQSLATLSSFSRALSHTSARTAQPHRPDIVPVLVDAQQLGLFAFKGVGQQRMVCFVPSCLAGRCYPAEAPKGKGMRVAVAAGVVGQQTVLLPAAVAGCSLFL